MPYVCRNIWILHVPSKRIHSLWRVSVEALLGGSLYIQDIAAWDIICVVTVVSSFSISLNMCEYITEDKITKSLFNIFITEIHSNGWWSLALIMHPNIYIKSFVILWPGNLEQKWLMVSHTCWMHNQFRLLQPYVKLSMITEHIKQGCNNFHLH
jgi:hypothetical protein